MLTIAGFCFYIQSPEDDQACRHSRNVKDLQTLNYLKMVENPAGWRKGKSIICTGTDSQAVNGGVQYLRCREEKQRCGSAILPFGYGVISKSVGLGCHVVSGDCVGSSHHLLKALHRNNIPSVQLWVHCFTCIILCWEMALHLLSKSWCSQSLFKQKQMKSAKKNHQKFHPQGNPRLNILIVRIFPNILLAEQLCISICQWRQCMLFFLQT